MSHDGDDFERERVRTVLRERLFGAASSPARLGRFEVRGRVGQGATGVVYRAYDPKLARTVALKLLHGHRSARVRRRLEEEGRAVPRLSHPNVVAIHDIGEREGDVFLAMELVVGSDLRTWLAAAPRGEREIVDVLRQAGAGLAAAHREALVHRDFKPENVLVGDGVVRVADFGLAALAGDDEADAGAPARIRPGTTPVGTPAYMAPEQRRGEPIDARADQYAFALVLLEALTGAHPVAGAIPANATAKLRAWLRPIVTRALAPDPAGRFPTMDALLTAIEARRGRSRRLLGVAAVGVFVVALGAMTVRAIVPGEDPCAGSEMRLDGIWDATRAASAARAFDRVELPFSERAYQGVRAGLDAYRERWITAHRDTCEATYVRHEQSGALLDRRMRCLERGREALRAAGEILAAADTSVVIRASRVVDELPSIAECRAADEPSAPAAEVDAPEAARALAVARASLAAGLFDAGRAHAERAVGRAHELHADRLEAEARTALGQSLHELGRYDEARASLFDGATLAITAGDHRSAARALVALARTLAAGVARWEEAERWARLAEAHLAGLVGADALEAERQLVLGEIWGGLSDNARAVTATRRAVELLRATYGEESPRLAAALTRLGFLSREGGGCPLVEQARQIRERVLGREHPDVAESYDRLATCAQIEGDEAQAAELFDRALALRRATLGPDHREVARSCFNFAALRLGQDRFEETAALYECARRGYVRAGNRNLEGGALAGLAEVRYRERRYDESLVLLDQVARIYAESIPREHGGNTRLEILRGNVLLASGRGPDALAHYQEAIRIAAAVREQPLVEATAQLGAGLAVLSSRDAAGAVPFLERAIALTEAGSPYQVEFARADGAIARFHLARALHASGRDRDRALALATTARQTLSTGPIAPRATIVVADIDAWLASPGLDTRRSEPGAASTLVTSRIRW